MRVLWREFFEPGPNSVSLDTVVERCYATDTVCNGYGCGVIRVAQGVKEVNFWSDTTFTINDPQAILYLEMDVWSDVDFSVGLNNPMYAGWQSSTITRGRKPTTTTALFVLTSLFSTIAVSRATCSWTTSSLS